MSSEYECRKCGHIIYSDTRPQSPNWDDGHRCAFYLVSEPKQEEKTMKQVTIYRNYDEDGNESYTIYEDDKFVVTTLLDEVHSRYCHHRTEIFDHEIDVCSFTMEEKTMPEEKSYQHHQGIRTITQNVMESFFNAKPRKMKGDDYDGFSGVEGQGYICEDDKLLYVADVNGDDLVIESYTQDGEPRDMLVFKLSMRFRDGVVVEDYNDEQ